MLGRLREVMDGIVPVRRANTPLAASLRTLAPDRGAGPEWQSTGYGEYYARSADVYAAVKLRAEAASRPPLQVREIDASGTARWVGPEHPVQRLLDTVKRLVEQERPAHCDGDVSLSLGSCVLVSGTLTAKHRPPPRRTRYGRCGPTACGSSGTRNGMSRGSSTRSADVRLRSCRRRWSGSATSTRWRNSPGSRRWQPRDSPPTWAWTRCGFNREFFPQRRAAAGPRLPSQQPRYRRAGRGVLFQVGGALCRAFASPAPARHRRWAGTCSAWD